MSYSSKINDPSFNKYLKNTKNYRWQFGFALAISAVLGFYLYGALSEEINNPEALYIGLGIGGMFFLIGIFSSFSGKKEHSWDGEVVDKAKIKQNNKIIFIVYIRDGKQQIHEIRSENDATLYDYYKVGEKVRYHGKLKTYEKYDKSRDDIIFCNACSFMHEISESICRNCGCPLLK